jgi:hypothetical protein
MTLRTIILGKFSIYTVCEFYGSTRKAVNRQIASQPGCADQGMQRLGQLRNSLEGDFEHARRGESERIGFQNECVR